MNQIDKHLTKIDLAIQKLTILETQNKERLDAHDNRIKAIEDKPVKAYEKHKEAIVASICSGIGGIILSVIVGLLVYFLR